MQASVMDRNLFTKVYRRVEAVHGREATDLDIDRAWNRYDKIVLKGK